MPDRTLVNELATQQLVRYEALFKLLDEIQSLDDVAAIAQRMAERWKYFANVAAWRLVVAMDGGFLAIDGYHGEARLAEVTTLSPWDAHHWTRQRPCINHVGAALDGPPPPEHLRGMAITDTLVLPFPHKGRCVGLLSTGASRAPLNDHDHRYIRLFGSHAVERIFGILTREQATRRIEANLAEREAMYQAVIETTTDGFWRHDAEGHILSANAAFLRRTGYSLEELRGMNIADFEAAESPSEVRQHIERIRRDGSDRFETRLRGKDGEIWPAEIVAAHSSKAGDLYFTFARDISARKRQEAALDLARERLALALRSLRCGVWDWDLVNDTLTWSEELFRLFGLDPATSTASYATWSELVHPEDRAAAEAHYRDALRNRTDYCGEYRIVLPSGETRWVEAHAELNLDAMARPRRMVGVTFDVTARKDAERTLATLRGNLQQVVEWQVARHTAAALAHELNQPLASIAMLCEAARRICLERNTATRHEAVPLLERMTLEAERAGNAVRNLLDSLHNVDVQRESADLAAIIREAVRLSRPEGGAKCRLVVDCAADLPRVMANRLQVEKVLTNLIGNSLDAIRRAGHATAWIGISAALAREGDEALVTVRDDGPGIDPTLQREMFHPFVTTRPDGFGMGLTISRALVEAQGGKLWYDAPHGPGAQFRFTLPVAR